MAELFGTGRAEDLVRAEITRLVAAGLAPTPERVRAAVGASQSLLGVDGAARRADGLAADVLGLGPLEPLAALPGVTDILVNGTTDVHLDRGAGLERVESPFADPEAVRRLAVRLAGLARRRLDDACPYVDGILPGAVRLHAVLPPLVDEPHLSLRLPRMTRVHLTDLQASGTLDPRLRQVLADVIAARLAVVVTGGTGAGKTTLLGALLAQIDPRERLLVVEDVRELVVDHPHVVSVQARTRNVEGAGEITLVDLVRQALRMRADRLVVGEVRGAEVRELLAALNTGHAGGCGTVHANSAQDVIARFEALGALAGMTPQLVWAQLASAVQVVVHIARTPVGRRVTQVGVVTGMATERPVVVDALVRHGAGPLEEGPGWPVLRGWLGGAS